MQAQTRESTINYITSEFGVDTLFNLPWKIPALGKYRLLLTEVLVSFLSFPKQTFVLPTNFYFLIILLLGPI
jgi:hypothetical protein